MTLEDVYANELKRGSGMNPGIFTAGLFIGNRNVALLIGALFAIWLLMKQRGFTLAKIGELIGPPFETAGVIILITSAGGAFGLMLKNAGVGKAVESAVAGRDINLILLSWLVAAGDPRRARFSDRRHVDHGVDHVPNHEHDGPAISSDVHFSRDRVWRNVPVVDE
jgi:hypothetical protein